MYYLFFLVYIDLNKQPIFRTLSETGLSKELNPLDLEYFKTNGFLSPEQVSFPPTVYKVYHPTDTDKEFHPSVNFIHLFTMDHRQRTAYELFHDMSDEMAKHLYLQLARWTPERISSQTKH